MTLGTIIQFLLTKRHINHVKSHSNTVPEAFSDKISLESHQKAAKYTQAKVKTGLYEYLLSITFLLIWTLGGGLQLLDATWRSTEMAELWTGVGFILSTFIIMSLLDLPISAYRTFGLEQRFGFNRSTPKIFITDLLKKRDCCISYWHTHDRTYPLDNGIDRKSLVVVRLDHLVRF